MDIGKLNERQHYFLQQVLQKIMCPIFEFQINNQSYSLCSHAFLLQMVFR